MTRLALLVGGACLVLPACRSPSCHEPPAENVMQAGQAPTPYSAAQIRESCRGAQWITETTTGGATERSMTRFPAGRDTEAEAEIEICDLDPSGAPSAPRKVRVAWAELQGHGSFPADKTKITTESCTTPAGTFECWRYDVSRGGDAPLQRFWFAKELPGPPVRIEVEAGGKRQSTTVLVERRKG